MDKKHTSQMDLVERSDEGKSAKGSTVSRVLDILEAVAMAQRPLTATELAAQLDIPKASLHRLCGMLEQQGFLQTSINQRGLQPGLRFHQTAVSVLGCAPYHAQRRAILTKLSQDIGETCNISVPDGAEMIYFDRAETHWPVRVLLQIGSRVPANSTAGGKMYLSTLPKSKRKHIIANMHRVPHTPNTLIDEQALLAELELTAKRGYSLDNEEYIEGMVAMAVPIVDSNNRLYATLSFHAPCMRVPFENVTDHLPALQRASEQLSTVLDD